MNAVCIIEGARGSGQDRAAVLHPVGAKVLVLADGAGGFGSGDLAAEAVIAEVKSALSEGISLSSVRPWIPRFLKLDRQLSGRGESTVVLAIAQPGRVLGLSAGDSVAWVLNAPHTTAPARLTDKQQKSRIGSGRAIITPFDVFVRGGVLLLASDGLWKFLPAERMQEILRELPLEDAGKNLVQSVRLPSGELQDDVSVVLATLEPP